MTGQLSGPVLGERILGLDRYAAMSGTVGKRGGFGRFASRMSRYAGHPAAFGIACLIILVWIVSGPILKFSDTWQLTINTGTTIVTFLMVFIIQNSQNRDTAALQVKLDELIRATKSATNAVLDLEQLSEEDIEDLRKRYEQLAAEARNAESAGENVNPPRSARES